MPRYYIEAYRADGSQILGNLDGQGVINAKQPRKTLQYKRLAHGMNRPLFPKVSYWLLVQDGHKSVEVIHNKFGEYFQPHLHPEINS